MIRSLSLVVLALLCGVPARGAPVRDGSRARSAAPRKPAAPLLRAVSVSPASMTLEGPGVEQGLLVTGVPQAGISRDLTRTAAYHSSAPKVAQVSPDGIVRAVGDGSASIEVRAGGKRASVAVRVRNTRVEHPVSFTRDVMPLLGKAGCNAATCHAKQGGKNGFQLSVLAFDPEADYTAIVRQAGGRRVNRLEPGASLLLTKATLAVAHGGGQRFKMDSPEYRLLARWIAEGARFGGGEEPVLTRLEVEPSERVMAPGQEQQLRVRAVYSDGSRRDVTRMAQFRSDETAIADVDGRGCLKTTQLVGEAAIMTRFMGQVAVTRVSVPLKESVPAGVSAGLPRFNFIDELVYRKLGRLNLVPSGLCDDATFLRRAFLDLIGTLPTADETRAFLAECEAERQGRSGFRHPEGTRGSGFRKDETTQPASGLSSGSPLNPEPRTLNPQTPRTPNARQRLIDRLLDRTEYADYWGMRWSNLLLVNPDLLLPRGAYAFDRWLRESFRANVPFDQFAREILTASGETYREGPPNFFRALPNPGDAGKSVSQLFLGVRLDCAQCHHHPFERWGQDDFYGLAAYFARVQSKSSYPEGYHSVIYAGTEGEVKHPKTDRVMAPRPLGGEPVEVPEGTDRRQLLVQWMTAPENPYFARAIVNRMWGLLMGRGIVEPVDDFRVTNPASNEPLLDALAKDFVAHRFDLKHLLRTITASAAYQRSSESTPVNARDTRNYSRYYKKRLPAEVLLDAVGQVTGVPETFRGHPQGTRAIQMWDSRLEVEFLEIFGRPVRQSVCECERPTDGSVQQLLHLMNSGMMQDRLSKDTGTVAALDRSGKPEEEIITDLYLTALNRYPGRDELAAARTAFTREKGTRRQEIEDILWALMNSAEFILNH